MKTVPIAPSLVGLAAIRSRHGGGEMGDCIRMSLYVMARANPEHRSLADYLWKIAHGGLATPMPSLTEPDLVAMAEEVRCLANPQIGGMRMLMSPMHASKEIPASSASPLF